MIGYNLIEYGPMWISDFGFFGLRGALFPTSARAAPYTASVSRSLPGGHDGFLFGVVIAHVRGVFLKVPSARHAAAHVVIRLVRVEDGGHDGFRLGLEFGTLSSGDEHDFRVRLRVDEWRNHGPEDAEDGGRVEAHREAEALWIMVLQNAERLSRRAHGDGVLARPTRKVDEDDDLLRGKIGVAASRLAIPRGLPENVLEHVHQEFDVGFVIEGVLAIRAHDEHPTLTPVSSASILLTRRSFSFDVIPSDLVRLHL